ncbi:DNA-directed RNA polymeras-like protein iii largest subunit [Aulographum hederae CBS 113979]|uniref:DNA-directed RNA polymerase subunit n=1 Tax=Aulographum hederae CBS 113979 TaxID=1176131 RepID=A0A6G1GPD8_9PEZI|nr:DNA-directed RNA polymeras-like protein iii largest subunit [Aulographum hederae CBS 113979]
MVKEAVDRHAPKRIKALTFGISSHDELARQSVAEISDRNLYEPLANSNGAERTVTKHGPLDRRLGLSSKAPNAVCETCNEDLKKCNGHFGHVKLALPCFHVGYMRYIIDTLNCICKDCSAFLLPPEQWQRHQSRLASPNLDAPQRQNIVKSILEECKKCKKCPTCNAIQGPVRKVPGHPLKLVHMKWDATYKGLAQQTVKKKEPPQELVNYEETFADAIETNPDVTRYMKKAHQNITPLNALNLFLKMTNDDCRLLGMNPDVGRPEMFIWRHFVVAPACIRPSVPQDSSTNEDDLTSKLGDIVQMNGTLRAALDGGEPIAQITELWEFLQLQIAIYINSDVPGMPKSEAGRPVRGLCQRLKGKQGRFRGNLSGKRVDFSGRTVISPDPNLAVDEIAVPERVAVNLTYPEKVSKYNFDRLKECVLNGKYKHPGAATIIKPSGNRINLEMFSRTKQLDKPASRLQIGDIVERHLVDGDIVLFNRQPSLHKLSILSHRAKIRPWRTFRLNECVCNPYNADFDGDEMNLHVPQTEEARAEALELMGVKYNLATPKNGTPIIAAIQDFITAAYLLSNKDRFYSMHDFAQIVCYMFDAGSVIDPVTKKSGKYDLPPPAIWKPQRLWTGKQIFNVLMRPNKECHVMVNLDAPCKQFKAEPGRSPYECPDDAYLVIRNSEVMSGVMDKSTVGDGKKDSVFYVIMRDFGPDYAVAAMNRLSKLAARWLGEQGFSIGIGDVYPSMDLEVRKEALVKEAYAKCDQLIADFKSGKLPRDPGCNAEQTMENKISGILSGVRQAAGDICFEQLSIHNAPLIMAKSGSKGSNINVSQMVAGVGQQMIGGARVADGFQDRTLPHFPKASRQPAAKGFVKNSFFSGLNPSEFLFHAMSGREGLVDTAVKTAETGYMSRRLMKSLEDLSTHYDMTVRNSESTVVQLQYGEDKLDPVDMEGKAKPVNFERTYTHAVAITWNNAEKGLYPYQIREITHDVLQVRRARYQRFALITKDGQSLLDYKDDSDMGVDEHESARGFLDAIEEFLRQRASSLARQREKLGFPAMNDRAASGSETETDTDLSLAIDGAFKLSEQALQTFLKLCLTKYDKSEVEPGAAVGATGAQSIGEPGTQMTLKTFHFAGVAGMSITQGVPRIKEIIGASKIISTPVITCALLNKVDPRVAQLVKARIEKTYLRDIARTIEECWSEDDACIRIRINRDTVAKLQLDISARDIIQAIVRGKGLKFSADNITCRGDTIICRVSEDVKRRQTAVDDDEEAEKTRKRKAADDHYARVQIAHRAIPNVVVSGYPDAHRAIIRRSDEANAQGVEEMSLLVEGYGLAACMATDGVDGLNTRTNSVMETRAVLGIEAARTIIIQEIRAVMGSMDIDPRHMQLLADTMTCKGEVFGITRHGLQKTRDSVLQLASFEKTPDHLFEAAWKNTKDTIAGVSESIIMGQTMKVGTGAFQTIRDLAWEPEDFAQEPETFMDYAAGFAKERDQRDKQEAMRAKREGEATSRAPANVNGGPVVNGNGHGTAPGPAPAAALEAASRGALSTAAPIAPPIAATVDWTYDPTVAYTVPPISATLRAPLGYPGAAPRAAPIVARHPAASQTLCLFIFLDPDRRRWLMRISYMDAKSLWFIMYVVGPHSIILTAEFDERILRFKENTFVHTIRRTTGWYGLGP